MTLGIEEWERPALSDAGRLGGEYLESIGKTDLIQLSKEEWETFLEVVCINYLNLRLDVIPF